MPRSFRAPAVAAMVLILLLAAFLRFHDLDAQSFWYDEGNSARIIERTPRLIIDAAAGDIHPPGYYLALAGWRLGAGFSEFALRAFSVFCGLLTVALTYALGARLLSRAAGTVGALIVAAHAFQVYYAQEARMYAMLAMVGAASMYAFVRWLDCSSSRRRWGVAWALLNTLGLYTQYVYPVVMLVQGVVFVWWWRRRRDRRVFVWYTALNLVTLALYLPWLPAAIRQITSWPTTGGDAPLGGALIDAASLLVFGGEPVAGGLDVLGVMLPLMLVGLLVRARARWALPLLWLWALLPPAGMLALGLHRGSFLKALLVGHAPLMLLAAWGLTALPPVTNIRPLQRVFALGMVLGLLSGWVHITDPANRRADYRAMAEYVEAGARPGDAVLLNAANQWEVFTYYHREDEPGRAPVYPIPRERPVDAEAVRAELDGLLAAHDRLFVLYWGDAESDPDRVVEGYLTARAFEVDSTWYKDVRLVTYAVPPETPTAPDVTLDARFGGAIRLQGYALSASEPLEPGSALALALFWEAEETPGGRYKVFVHLVDAGSAVAAQHDAEPGGGLRPTDAWQAGEQITDNHGLLVPADAVPGVYRILVGMYDITDPAARLPLALDGEPAGDALPLTEITIE